METKYWIEVAYVTPRGQHLIPVEVDSGITLEEAITLSGILELCPEIDLRRQKVGVFSQARVLSDKVYEGDRIEIYRSLEIDPKEARKQRAAK